MYKFICITTRREVYFQIRQRIQEVAKGLTARIYEWLPENVTENKPLFITWL